MRLLQLSHISFFKLKFIGQLLSYQCQGFGLNIPGGGTSQFGAPLYDGRAQVVYQLPGQIPIRLDDVHREIDF